MKSLKSIGELIVVLFLIIAFFGMLYESYLEATNQDHDPNAAYDPYHREDRPIGYRGL